MNENKDIDSMPDEEFHKRQDLAATEAPPLGSNAGDNPSRHAGGNHDRSLRGHYGESDVDGDGEKHLEEGLQGDEGGDGEEETAASQTRRGTQTELLLAIADEAITL